MTTVLVSPWAIQFDALIDTATHSLFLCAPYIGAGPCERITTLLRARGDREPPRIQVLTDLSLQNMLSGATDVAALREFVRALPQTTVSVLPSLHAKVYIADARQAVVTSANLTSGGLWRNFELGVVIDDSHVVASLLDDLMRYGRLGSPVDHEQLALLADIALELRDVQRRAERTIRSGVRREFKRRLREADEQVLRVRTSGRTAHAIFADAILHVLRSGPKTTDEIHASVRAIHPDLCDDTVERIIDGKRFGKKWKHAVRTAQQHLKRRGLAEYEEGLWGLTEAGLGASGTGELDFGESK